MLNQYERILPREQIDRGLHRGMVGGHWEDVGKLQFDFMVGAAGLEPEMNLLDVGCGALRGGLHFIRYLEPGNYYGLDSNASLIEAGWRVEIPRAGLGGRIRRGHLLRVDDFGACRFGVAFDRAIALSLWTHLPAHLLERSLWETARVLKPGGSLYATLFLCDDQQRLFEPITHDPGAITTHRDRDPFHYTWRDIVHACESLGLEAELIGEWGHPRAQQMVRVSMPHFGVTPSREEPRPASDGPPRSTWGGLSRAVCVLGMHRSGTSALAGSLQAAGLPAGEVVTEAGHNRRGNRENLEIRALNDAVLEASNGSWDHPPDSLRWTPEQAGERDRLIGEFSGHHPLWSFKDPRTLLTLPFWRGGAAELVFAGIFRQPASVVASLRARGPIAGRAPLESDDALRLWSHLNRILLELHRSDPFPLLCFDASPREFARQINAAVELFGERLGDPDLLSSADAQAFYEAGLVHQGNPRGSLDGVDDGLLREAERIYGELEERSLLGARTAPGSRVGAPAAKPRSEARLTVVVNFFEMRREAERTLHTLSPAYQREVAEGDYEVVAIDNGSAEPLAAEYVHSFGANFRHVQHEQRSPSPAAVLNRAVREAGTPWVICLIDGARMLSPGILRGVRAAMELASDPLVYTINMHLGPDTQPALVARGWTQADEDALLEGVPWQRNGYRLFPISSIAPSHEGGYFGRHHPESGCFAVRRETFLEVGGFDERFESPGGGLVNLDLFYRLVTRPGATPVCLLGEATFHQVHGGAATNAPPSERPWEAFAQEYERIRGCPWAAPTIDSLYLGRVPPGRGRRLLAPRSRGPSSG